MNVATIANEIYIELGSPLDFSTSSISFWVKANVGVLNNLINTKFKIDLVTSEINYVDDDSIKVEIGIEEVAILKKMYFVYDYDYKLRQTLGASSWDSVVEISDAGTRIRKVNKSEISKTLVQTKKDEASQLKELVHAYKLRLSNPTQVAGDDTVEGSFPSEYDIR